MFSAKLKTALSIFIWAIIWEILRVFLFKDQTLFPSLLDILKNTFRLFFYEGNFNENFMASTQRFMFSLAIAAPLAIVGAVLVVGSKIAHTLFYPIISFTYPLPKVALFPFLLLIFGLGDAAKISMISLGMFYLIFINIYSGLKIISQGQLGDIVRTYNIQGFNYWYHFLLKGSFTYFLIGLKSALGYGLTLVVVSEISMAKNGIGFFIWSAWDSFRILDLYSGLFILALVGYFLNVLCDVLIQLKNRV